MPRASTQFGVNLTQAEARRGLGAAHWHENEDELVYILEGEIVLVEDERRDRAASRATAAGCKAGAPNGHALVNRSQPRRAVYIEIGTRAKS